MHFLGALLKVSSAVVPGDTGQLSTEWYREYRYNTEQKNKITEYREWGKWTFQDGVRIREVVPRNCIRWANYWSFSFTISPSNEYSGLISFRMDWFDLLTVQGTLKSLLQHHSSKASIPQRSAFFTVQLSHPYMTTGKTIALTRRTFVGKVMSLLFNMLSRLVITFLPRRKENQDHRKSGSVIKKF